jgi:hypothetical protein
MSWLLLNWILVFVFIFFFRELMINTIEVENMSPPPSSKPLQSQQHETTAVAAAGDSSPLLTEELAAASTQQSSTGSASVTKRQHETNNGGGSITSSNRRSVLLASSAADLADGGGEEADAEWAKLRCGSLTTEELVRQQQEREARRSRQNRCADYPGLAFGSAMFGSDTTMKFNIIKNELHNIMRSQLKRVDGEVNALATRVKDFDRRLEMSAELIRGATTALAEAVAVQVEAAKNSTEEESSLSAFDQHVLFLEGQLKEARLKASVSFQILEDCHRAQAALLHNQSSNLSLSDSSPPLSAVVADHEKSLSSLLTSSSSSLSSTATTMLQQQSTSLSIDNSCSTNNSCSANVEDPAVVALQNLTNNNNIHNDNNEVVGTEAPTVNGSHNQLLKNQDYLNANNLSAALS